jgi:RHS repeat-associated protein
LHDGAQVLAELRSGAVDTTYHTGIEIDEVLARYGSQGNKTLLIDGLSSVIAQANDDQSMQSFYGYTPYGESQTFGPDGENSLQFGGRENDQTGLYFYRARYYDPVLKRFIAEDPIGIGGGSNVYAFTNGNPVTFRDPLGREVTMTCRALSYLVSPVPQHCSVIVWHWDVDKCGKPIKVIDKQYSVTGGGTTPLPQGSTNGTYVDDRKAFTDPRGFDTNWDIPPPPWMTQRQFDQAVTDRGDSYRQGPYSYDPFTGYSNSNTAAYNIISGAGGDVPQIPAAWGQPPGSAFGP